MSLVKYEIFNKVAEMGNFTKAGESLGLTQSAVSHAISSLEKEFGFSLVHRIKTGIKVTTEGEVMLKPIRQMLYAQEILRQEAANILGVTKGTVRVGTFSSISSKWMPHIIKLLDQHYTGIKIELREGDYYEIEQWLLDGEIDCGFLNRTHSNQFQFAPLIRDQLVCIVSSNNSLFTKNEVDLNEIISQPFIMSSYKGTNDVLTIFEAHGIKPNVRFELFDEEGILSMVENDLGISILPKLVLNHLPGNVRAIPIKQESYRTIGLCTKQQKSPATKKFVEVLIEWLSINENLTKLE
ncbi:LysR family transcriptional regulator [Ureibacillus sp. NPDC094379]